MPTGIYEHKKRSERITVHCEVCNKATEFLPSQVKQRPNIRFCSMECMGIATRKPKRYNEVECKNCGVVFTKRVDHTTENNYCSKPCSSAGHMVEGAKWRDPAHIKKYMAEYLDRNREEMNRKAVLRNQGNPLRLATQKRYSDSHKAQTEVRRMLRIACQKAHSFTRKEWVEMKERYNYTCLRCKKREPEIKLQRDHVVPVSAGGINSASNIQPLCRRCNPAKGIKSTDYRPSLTVSEDGQAGFDFD
jgi:5-methylcytosine-specific restriction endonuclease McrA